MSKQKKARASGARIAALGGVLALLATVAAACSEVPTDTSELTGEVQQAVLYCGGDYCATGEVCCSVGGTSSCMTSSDCCTAQGKHICGRACVDFQSDPYNCGGCGITCQGLCSSGACVPVTVQSTRLSLNAIDLGVAASNHFVLANNNMNFALLDRYSFLQAVTNTEMSGGTAPTGQTLQGGENLFRNFLYDDTPENVNKTLFNYVPTAVACNWTSPFSSATTPPPGIVMGKDEDGNSYHWPSSSCMNVVYDVGASYFDAARQRFWIFGHAKNDISTDSCDMGASTDQTLCSALNSQARRFTLVAVSKTSDPHDGFWKYVVAKDYVDQPKMAVHNDYAMFFHNNGGPFHIYDAAAMAAGPTLPAELKVGGKVLQAGVDFAGSHIRVAKHHEGASTITYVLSASSAHTNELWIYALQSPHPTGSASSLLGPAHYVDPSGRAMYVHDAVFANGYLYIVASEAGAASVWRMPISQSDVSGQVEINPNTVSRWSISTSGQSVGYTTIDVTSGQDVVVGYNSFDSSTPPDAPNLARYAVLYHNETAFRAPRSVADLTGTTGLGSKQLDFVGSVRDSYDTSAIWTALADENGYVLTFIHP